MFLGDVMILVSHDNIIRIRFLVRSSGLVIGLWGKNYPSILVWMCFREYVLVIREWFVVSYVGVSFVCFGDQDNSVILVAS